MQCRTCKVEKPLTEFYKALRRMGTGHQTECKSCTSHKASDSYNELRLKIIAKYGNKCVCCGESEPLFLTFDHKNGGRGSISTNPRTIASWWYTYS